MDNINEKHIWMRARRSFKRSGEAFKKTPFVEPEEDKDAEGGNALDKKDKKVHNEADQSDVDKLRAFNAILDQKPHDAKEAVNDLMANKLEYRVADYKSELARSIFNGDQVPSLARPESEEGSEEEIEVKEHLRAPGKANQQVVSDKDTPSPMQLAEPRSLKRKK